MLQFLWNCYCSCSQSSSSSLQTRIDLNPISSSKIMCLPRGELICVLSVDTCDIHLKENSRDLQIQVYLPDRHQTIQFPMEIFQNLHITNFTSRWSKTNKQCFHLPKRRNHSLKISSTRKKFLQVGSKKLWIFIFIIFAYTSHRLKDTLKMIPRFFAISWSRKIRFQGEIMNNYCTAVWGDVAPFWAPFLFKFFELLFFIEW